ncbi:MAG: hypothetical protein FD155_1004 [Bacteroidetes bacterium]|nr:MAG: hypothetical protein FD155_1004 [Bacteroidota bacterium]
MVQIRKAKPEEAIKIVDFQLKMALETEQINLDETTLNEGVKKVFQYPEKGEYYVAIVNNTIVASLLITFEWSDWRNRTIYWIQSVYVDKAHRRQGIYATMYAYIKELAENDPAVGGIRLYVDKTNTPAQKTYSSLGMNGEHYQVFEWMKVF